MILIFGHDNHFTKGRDMTESEIRQGMIYKDDTTAILRQGEDVLFLVDLKNGGQIELTRKVLLELRDLFI